MQDHTRIILKRMCKSVNADFDKINFKDKFWFEKYSWSKTKQENFVIWLAQYLYDNLEARKELMRFPRKTKKHCLKVAIEFVSDYGWKTK